MNDTITGMAEETLHRLETLEEDGERVKTWPFVSIGNDTDRLYYRPSHYGPDCGFHFIVVRFAVCDSLPPGGGSVFDQPSTYVEVIIRGSACFDGIRHMWCPIEDGYLHYPNLDIFAELQKLEDQHCWDSYRNRDKREAAKKEGKR